MKIDLTALLDSQAEHYALPRGGERFQAHLAEVFGSDEALCEPIAPSPSNGLDAGEVLACVEAHRALDAEAFVRDSLSRLGPRLPDAGELQLSLMVVDDGGGLWTGRRLSWMHPSPTGILSRGCAIVPLWSSEAVTREGLERAVHLAVFRALHVRAQGAARDLAERMSLEGRARRFAGDRAPRLDPEELWFVRRVLQPYLDTSDPALTFACLFGDRAARAVGYPALGLSTDAGLALALADAGLESGGPEAQLTTDRSVARLATG